MKYSDICRSKWAAIVFAALSTICGQAVSGEQEKVDFASKFDVMLGELRKEQSTVDRAHLAYQFSDLVKQQNPEDIDDRQMDEIVQLLYHSDKSVRSWALTTLVNLGSRAVGTIPVLQKMYEEKACKSFNSGGKPSAWNLRQALENMGARVEKPICTGGKTNERTH